MKDKIARIIDPLAFSFTDPGVFAIYENDRAKALHLAGKILDAIAAKLGVSTPNDRGVAPAEPPWSAIEAPPAPVSRWCYDPVKGAVWHISDPLKVLTVARGVGRWMITRSDLAEWSEGAIRDEIYEAMAGARTAMGRDDGAGVFAKLVAGILNDRGVRP